MREAAHGQANFPAVSIQRHCGYFGWCPNRGERNSDPALAASAGLLLANGRRTGAATKGGEHVATRQINVQRFSVISSESFNDVVAEVEAAIGHPDMSAFRKNITAS